MVYKDLEKQRKYHREYMREYRRKNKEKHKEWWKKSYEKQKNIDRICLNCGEHFKATKYNPGKYCSRLCQNIAINKRKKRDENGKIIVSEETKQKISNSLKGKRNPSYKGPVIVECSYCGKKIGKEVGRFKKNKSGKFFCNPSCQNKFFVGENHSQWQGGKSFEPYCILFNEGFKERVREFWDRKCAMSGITEEENGRKLAVHHVSYDKTSCCESDKASFNCAPNLFIAVSQGWNSKFNHNRDYWEEYLTNYIMIWFNGECYFPKD
jgi:hypothetical protein